MAATSWQIPQTLWSVPEPTQTSLLRVFQSQQEWFGTKIQFDSDNSDTVLVSASNNYRLGKNYQFILGPDNNTGGIDINWGLSVDFSANYGTVDQKTILSYFSGNVNRICGIYDHRINSFVFWADNAANPIVRVAWTVASSEEVKTNIQDLTATARATGRLQTALAQLCELRPVTFNYKDDSPTDKLRFGFIAEELIDVFPDLVTPAHDETPMGITYDGLIPVIVTALAEIQARLTTLEGKSGITISPGIGHP